MLNRAGEMGPLLGAGKSAFQTNLDRVCKEGVQRGLSLKTGRGQAKDCSGNLLGTY